MALEKDLSRAKRDLLRTLSRYIPDEKVIRAMDRVPRELFVPPESRDLAYKDIPLPIGEGQTISQPYIVAFMTSLLSLRGTERVLEIGTGSGYQAAVLSHLVPQGSVLTLERCPGLAQAAAEHLERVGCANVEVQSAGEELGAPIRAPFDAVIVTAASPRLPSALVDQMCVGGRMVIPVGPLKGQMLLRVLRTGEGPTIQLFGSCRFVPLIGKDGWPPGTCDD